MNPKSWERDNMRDSDSTLRNTSREVCTHCYLCGGPLRRSKSKDHCPPKVLFPKEMRIQLNASQLITIPTHEECNRSYREDEEYFEHVMHLFSAGSTAGKYAFDKFKQILTERTETQKLGMHILRSLDLPRIGPISSAEEMMKRISRERIERVAWKIVRGLYLHHHRAILPEDCPVEELAIVSSGEVTPDAFVVASVFSGSKRLGKYPNIFDYFFCPIETDTGGRQCCALLIWERIMITICFHDPWSCQCEYCAAALVEMKCRMDSATS